jgi:hypothetical protein
VRTRLALALGAVVLSVVGSGPVGASSTSAQDCSRKLAGPLSRAEHRACVVAVVSTYLDAKRHAAPAARALLDPQVAAYQLGDAPAHRAGNATAVRRALTADKTRRLSEVEWVVDGDLAMVTYLGQRGAARYYVGQRFTLRRGLIWEVLTTAEAAPGSSASTPSTPISSVSGPPAAMPAAPDYDSGPWCSVRLAVRGDASLTPEQHRRCVIAIASTYVNSEENSIPGNQILFDPRFSKRSLGGAAVHHPANSDLNRTQQGTFQGTTGRVIRSIDNRRWVVEGNTAWILYDGWLVVSTTHPGFYVTERFTLRDGLIWDITIAPIATSIP